MSQCFSDDQTNVQQKVKLKVPLELNNKMLLIVIVTARVIMYIVHQINSPKWPPLSLTAAFSPLHSVRCPLKVA